MKEGKIANMKIIRVTPDMEITEHDIPEGAGQYKAICDLIGGGCTLYESVWPRRLYNDWGFEARPTRVQGQSITMLVDEEFIYHNLQEFNPAGSWLYETELHGNPIMGNILFAGQKWEDGAIDICSIEERTAQQLEESLQILGCVRMDRKEDEKMRQEKEKADIHSKQKTGPAKDRMGMGPKL